VYVYICRLWIMLIYMLHNICVCMRARRAPVYVYICRLWIILHAMYVCLCGEIRTCVRVYTLVAYNTYIYVTQCVHVYIRAQCAPLCMYTLRLHISHTYVTQLHVCACVRGAHLCVCIHKLHISPRHHACVSVRVCYVCVYT